MRRFHLALGFLTLIAFLATGAYMASVLQRLEGYSDATRLFYRSRHLYILAAALAQLGLGAHLRRLPNRVRFALQGLGSLLLTAASPLLLMAFYQEPQGSVFETYYSHLGLYALFGGVLLHVLATLPVPRKRAGSR